MVVSFWCCRFRVLYSPWQTAIFVCLGTCCEWRWGDKNNNELDDNLTIYWQYGNGWRDGGIILGRGWWQGSTMVQKFRLTIRQQREEERQGAAGNATLMRMLARIWMRLWLKHYWTMVAPILMLTWMMLRLMILQSSSILGNEREHQDGDIGFSCEHETSIEWYYPIQQQIILQHPN